MLMRPYATILHVFSVFVGMGSALFSDAIFSFFSRDKKLDSREIGILSKLSKIVIYSLFVISISGILIFLSDVSLYISSTKFMSKMTILGVLILNGYLLNRYIWPELVKNTFFTSPKKKTLRKLAFVCGAISVVSWISVFVLGTMSSIALGYTMVMLIFASILLLASIVSVIIERIEFN
jgi:hypothetical protein